MTLLYVIIDFMSTIAKSTVGQIPGVADYFWGEASGAVSWSTPCSPVFAAGAMPI